MFKGNVGRKGNPFQGPREGSYLTLGSEFPGETHADEIRDFTGKGLPGREQGKGTQGTLLCHMFCSLRFYDDGVGFRVVSGQSF